MPTHRMEVSFWQENTHCIKISLGEQDGITGITSVSDNEKSKRGNPHLFNQLRQILINEGKWNINN